MDPDPPVSEHSPVSQEETIDSSSTISPPPSSSSGKKLNLLQLAILVFYNVSGGPFGIEPSLRAAGNFYTIIGFLVLPFVWSFPEAMVTAELGSAFRSSSGGVIWVQTAFGDFPGALCGYFNWISGATDNAIYPMLFLTYLAGDSLNGIQRFLYVSLLSIALAYLNYLGLEFVGNSSIVVCIIALSPFVIMLFLGIGDVDPKNWLQTPVNVTDVSGLFDDDFETAPGFLPLVSFGGIIMRPFLNNMFWNLNSFDCAASFADEVVDVRTTFPNGIFLGLGLCYIFYLIPLLLVTGATEYSQSEWVDGHLATIASDIGGDWLGKWMIFAIGISNIALFEAELSSDAFQLMGMAEQGYLPKIFATRSKYGTPTAGILAGTVVIVFMSLADFSQLVEILNANYAISLLMEYAAFVKLRISNKELERPYRIPIPDWFAFFFVLPPILAITYLIALSSWTTYIFTGAVFCTSVVLIGAQQMSKGKQRNKKEKKEEKEFVEMASLYQYSDTLEMEEHEVL
jgi:amino acid transporter